MAYLEEISVRINQVITDLFGGKVSELSRKIDVNPDTISTYIGKKGKISMPPAEFIWKLMDKVGISSDWIIAGIGQMKKVETVNVVEVTPEYILSRLEHYIKESKDKDSIIEDQNKKIETLTKQINALREEKKEFTSPSIAAQPSHELKKKHK